jgi:hypothetical protein
MSIGGISQYVGQRTFAVTGLAAYSASITGIPQEQIAGSQLNTLTIRLTDRLGNPLSGTIGAVALRHSRGFYHLLSSSSQANGVYSVQGMQLTTVGTYTLSIGGIATENITGNRVVTVAQAPVASAAFLYVDSSFNVGGKQTAFRVTYRDAFGNLLNGPDSVRAVSGNASSTSTIALTNISLGVYTATATAFSVPGAYTLSVAGVSEYTGQRTFTVNSIAASNALVTGLPSALTAGAQTGSFSIRLTDAQNNPVSNSIGVVTLRHERGFTHLLAVTPQTNGVYSVQGIQATTVGTYTLSIGGIVAANITGNRVVTVTQAPVASAAFQYVDSSFNVGGKQTAFRVTYRDAFGNLLNGPDSVRAVSGNGSSTSTITLTNISLGVYTATATAFSVPGAYTLSVAGVTTYNGQRTFTVNSIAASNALVTGVPTALTAGAQTGTFTIRLTDNLGNAVSGNIGAVTLRHERGFTHLLPTQAQANGVYSVQGIQATTVGTYTLSIGGIVAANITGNRAVAVTPDAVANATFQSVDTSITAGGNQVGFRVTYRDAFGNLADGSESASASNGGTSTATIALTRSSIGVYTATPTAFTRAGSYSLSIVGVQPLGVRTFTVLPAGAATVEVRGVQASIARGAQQSGISLAIADRFGNPTDRSTSVLRFARTTSNPASTGTITLTRTALGVMTAEATAFAVVGSYRLTVDGITASALLGTNTFTVTTAATVAAFSKNGESSLNTAQNNAETSVGVREEAVAGVTPLSVMTYPNPAVNDMELVVRLPREERVTITLRDNLGRVVAVVAETTMKSGENRLQYNLSTLPSGVYHCMVQSLSQRSMTQVIIAR